MAETPKTHTVVIAGKYHYRDSNRYAEDLKGAKDYSEDFILPGAHAARGEHEVVAHLIAAGGPLEQRLKKKDARFRALHSHTITSRK